MCNPYKALVDGSKALGYMTAIQEVAAMHLKNSPITTEQIGELLNKARRQMEADKLEAVDG